MRVQYNDPAKPAMIDGEWRSAKCDDDARLEVVLGTDSPLVQPLGPWVTQDVVAVPVEPDAALQLPNIACKEIKLVAHPSNTKPIYIGDSAVNSTDVPPTNASYGEIMQLVTNANQFYVVAAFASQQLQFQTR